MSAKDQGAASCDGSANCKAETHIHGCFADRGNCDSPFEHARAELDAQEFEGGYPWPNI